MTTVGFSFNPARVPCSNRVTLAMHALIDVVNNIITGMEEPLINTTGMTGRRMASLASLATHNHTEALEHRQLHPHERLLDRKEQQRGKGVGQCPAAAGVEGEVQDGVPLQLRL